MCICLENLSLSIKFTILIPQKIKDAVQKTITKTIQIIRDQNLHKILMKKALAAAMLRVGQSLWEESRNNAEKYTKPVNTPSKKWFWLF